MKPLHLVPLLLCVAFPILLIPLLLYRATDAENGEAEHSEFLPQVSTVKRSPPMPQEEEEEDADLSDLVRSRRSGKLKAAARGDVFKVRSAVASSHGPTVSHPGPIQLSSPTERLSTLPRVEYDQDAAAMAKGDFVDAATDAVVSLSIDTGSASFDIAQTFLSNGQLPDAAGVLPEQWINAFDYAYPVGKVSETQPFAVAAQIMATPWNSASKLLQVGIKAALPSDFRPPLRLVFLVDCSGSMGVPSESSLSPLDVVKTALRTVIEGMTDEDSLAIVAYADSPAILTGPTKDKDKLIKITESLTAGGSTAGGSAMADAYRLAREHFEEGAVNRIIMATDGDLNVGTVDKGSLGDFVAGQRATGIYLTALLTCGHLSTCNVNLIQELAKRGSGRAVMAATAEQASRLFDADNIAKTLVTVANDVKIQVALNPLFVSKYRLIGYDTRRLTREQFTNDHEDAGEVNVGQTVTALIEIMEHEAPSRYGRRPGFASTPVQAKLHANEAAEVRIRFKPRAERDAPSHLIKVPVATSARIDDNAELPPAFAAQVAALALYFRGDKASSKLQLRELLKQTVPLVGVASSSTSSSTRASIAKRKAFLKMIQKAIAIKDLVK